MTIEIRRATRADIPAMARIVVAWEAATEWMPDGTIESDVIGMIDEVFDHRQIYVANDPVAAYMSIDADAHKIGALYCDRQRQGIGKALVDTAKAGRDFLWLQTHQPNIAAHRFYLREGFDIAGEIAPEAEGEPAQYRMEWRA